RNYPNTGLVQLCSTFWDDTAFLKDHKLSRKGKVRNHELRFHAVKEAGGFLELKNTCWGCVGGFLRRCNRRDWESSEGDIELENEILEFMKNSKNPEMFPSKKQLIDAGRVDLVEAISKEGGWLALGWDLDDNAYDVDVDVDLVDWYSSLTASKECSAAGIQDNAIERNEEQSSQVPCSSSGRSLERVTEDDAGIGGILYRLEKERNMNLGFALKELESTTHVQSSEINHDWLAKTTKNGTVAGPNANNIPGLLNPKSSVSNDLGDSLDHSRSLSNTDGSGNSLNPDMWRTWSIKRAGFSDMQFEAEELSSNRTRSGGEKNVLGEEILETREGASETVNRRKENCSDGGINQIQVRSRLWDLELELSSVLQLLKSNTGESVSQKVDNGSSSDDLLKLSDAWEFQENEIMNAQGKLRSTRAKLAVLEGKMALAIIDAQKLMEEKQKRIDDASRALKLLRTACIVWPSSASEIKFIVDGEWRIDPLRPIVHNNGHENNLLIIT
ncbi:unnamed protein product, partial [Dovyalis caffra]